MISCLHLSKNQTSFKLAWKHDSHIKFVGVTSKKKRDERIHDRFRSGVQLFQLVIINTYLLFSLHIRHKNVLNQFYLLVKKTCSDATHHSQKCSKTSTELHQQFLNLSFFASSNSKASFYFSSTLSIFFIGCQMLFTGDSVEHRLVFFPSDSVHQEQTVDVPANQRCTFYYGNLFYVQYLECSGSWRSIESLNVLENIELTFGWSSSQLKIRVS